MSTHILPRAASPAGSPVQSAFLGSAISRPDAGFDAIRLESTIDGAQALAAGTSGGTITLSGDVGAIDAGDTTAEEAFAGDGITWNNPVDLILCRAKVIANDLAKD